MNEKQGVFDRIVGLGAFAAIRPFYKANKEVLLYLLFGGCTTGISIVSFTLLYYVGLNEHSANVISWILAVTFAFWTNRTWVFQAAGGSVTRQMLAFYCGRLLTLGVDELLIFVFVSHLSFSAVWVKVAAQFFVLVANYFVSKLGVFVRSRDV